MKTKTATEIPADPADNPRRPAPSTAEVLAGDTIPPTEPIKLRVQAKEPSAPKTFATTRIAPEDLTHGTPPERVEGGHWYWVGILPGAPCSNVTVGGIAFPRSTEACYVNTRDPNVNERIPIEGDILRLTREEIQSIASAVARRGVRFVHAGNPEAEAKRAQEGYLSPLGEIVRYSRQADIDEARAAGRLAVPVLPRGGDRPLGDFLYCELLKEDCPRPRWLGQHDLPRPISEVGIELPGPDAIAPPAGAKVNYQRREGFRLWNA